MHSELHALYPYAFISMIITLSLHIYSYDYIPISICLDLYAYDYTNRHTYAFLYVLAGLLNVVSNSICLATAAYDVI